MMLQQLLGYGRREEGDMISIRVMESIVNQMKRFRLNYCVFVSKDEIEYLSRKVVDMLFKFLKKEKEKKRCLVLIKRGGVECYKYVERLLSEYGVYGKWFDVVECGVDRDSGKVSFDSEGKRLLGKVEEVIILDDIIETGKTVRFVVEEIKRLNKKLKELTVIVLYKRKGVELKGVNVRFIKEVVKGMYLVFPWEVEGVI